MMITITAERTSQADVSGWAPASYPMNGAKKTNAIAMTGNAIVIAGELVFAVMIFWNSAWIVRGALYQKRSASWRPDISAPSAHPTTAQRTRISQGIWSDSNLDVCLRRQPAFGKSFASLFADIPYVGIHVHADIAVCGRRHRLMTAIDDVGLVVMEEIEKLTRADFFARWLFPFNVATDGVDGLTECIFSDRSFRVHELDRRGAFHFGGDLGLCLIQDGIGRFGGLARYRRAYLRPHRGRRRCCRRLAGRGGLEGHRRGPGLFFGSCGGGGRLRG